MQVTIMVEMVQNGPILLLQQQQQDRRQVYAHMKCSRPPSSTGVGKYTNASGHYLQQQQSSLLSSFQL